MNLAIGTISYMLLKEDIKTLYFPTFKVFLPFMIKIIFCIVSFLVSAYFPVRD